MHQNKSIRYKIEKMETQNQTEQPDFNELMQQIALLESTAKKFMTKESIARYGNLKMAHPETAIKAIAMIAQAAQLGQLSMPITDMQFKELLLEIQHTQGKKQFNFKISRK